MKRLQNRVAVITGGGHGIGKAYARHLAQQGAAAVIAEIDGQAAQTAAKQIREEGLEALGILTDVGSEESLQHMVRQTMKTYGRIDILINNAAIYATIPVTHGGFDQITPDEWDRVMHVNVKGTWLACRAVVPYMKQQGKGKIVNISSGTAFHGGSGSFIHYVTSKAGVLGFTRTLAKELGEYNINVNCLAPGYTESEEQITEQILQYRKTKPASRAIKRAQVPEDLLGAVLFLSSDDSDFITGQTLVVDGGNYMH